MRLLLLQSKNETVHVHFCEGSASCACERCRQGIPRGPNDIVVQVVHVGASCGAPLACEKEPRKPAASGEQKQEAGQPAVDSAPQKLFDPSQEQQTERTPVIEARDRPLVRTPLYRRYRWPPSAYGS